MAFSYKNLAAFVGALWALLVFLTFVPLASANTIYLQANPANVIPSAPNGSGQYFVNSPTFDSNFNGIASSSMTWGLNAWIAGGGTTTLRAQLIINPATSPCSVDFTVNRFGATYQVTQFGCNLTGITVGTVLYYQLRSLDGTQFFTSGLGDSPYVVITDQDGNFQSFPVFTPGTDVLQVATSTTNVFCDTNVPFDSSSIIQATLTAVPNGLCKVGAFLLIPNQNSLGSFANLSSSTQDKIPFSYFYDVQGLVTGSATSTSQNSQVFSMDLSIMDFASSTSMGPILPNVLTFFSSSTIGQYMSPATHDLLYNLMIFAIWGDVMWMIYHKIVPTKVKI